MLAAVLFALSASVLALFETTTADGGFPLEAETTILVRSAPLGTTPVTLVETIEYANPYFSDYRLGGRTVMTFGQSNDTDSLSWRLPASSPTVVTNTEVPPFATGTWTVRGEPSTAQRVQRDLEDAGYEFVAQSRPHGLRSLTWLGDPPRAMMLTGFFALTLAVSTAALNRRIKARAISLTLGIAGLRTVLGDALVLSAFMLATDGLIAGAAIGILFAYSPTALTATSFLGILGASFLVAGIAQISALAIACVLTQTRRIPLISRLRAVQPQRPIIAASLASLALLAGTALIGNVSLAANADRILQVSRAAEQWADAPDTVSVSVQALDEASIGRASPPVREIIRSSDARGSAVLADVGPECFSDFPGPAAPCVVHVNDAFFELSGQDPAAFSLPPTTEAELLVAVPRSLWADREALRADAEAWSTFETEVDCEVLEGPCVERPAPPEVRLVVYDGAPRLKTLTANAGMNGQPAVVSQPVLYSYSLSSPWLSAANSIHPLSSGGLSFRESEAAVLQEFTNAGLGPLVADVHTGSQQALISSTRARDESILLAIESGSVTLAAAGVAGVLAHAHCRRQRQRLFAGFILGQRWSARHRRLLLLAAIAFAIAAAIGGYYGGIPSHPVLILDALTLLLVSLCIVVTAVRFDRSLGGLSVKER